MAKFFNRARMTTATTGTGTITLGAAVSNSFLTFAEAGVANGDVVAYCIEDGLDFEIGIGTYTSSGTTLSRTTVRVSKIAGTAGTSKIDLSGSATVFLSPDKEDLLSVTETIAANLVLAGPASGGAAAPTFRAAVGADIPTATQADEETASSTTVFVSPGRQQFHPSAAKYWQRTTVSGGTPTLQQSYNVSSITDTATGRLTVTIATDFSSAGWASLQGIQPAAGVNLACKVNTGGLAAGSVEIAATNLSTTLTDPAEWYSAGFGDQ